MAWTTPLDLTLGSRTRFAGDGRAASNLAGTLRADRGVIGPRSWRTTGLAGEAPPLSGRVDICEIPAGEKGTEATIAAMARFASGDYGSRHPGVIELARKLVRDLPSKAYRQEAQRIFDFVREHVRYVLDPRGLEWVQTPYHTLLVVGQGDCDDHATAIAALAMALGHGAAFKTVCADRRRPEEASHVYAMIGIREAGKIKWLGADTTTAEADLGWEPSPPRAWGGKMWTVAAA